MPKSEGLKNHFLHSDFPIPDLCELPHETSHTFHVISFLIYGQFKFQKHPNTASSIYIHVMVPYLAVQV